MPSRARIATYRVQLGPDLDFDDVVDRLAYLADLGISHVYLSPPFEAVPGSTHGYDVVDHTRVRSDLGGEAGIERLFAAAIDHSIGLLVDIVPNHMAVLSADNPVWWQALTEGPGSPAARYFDVDWAAEEGGGRGRILVPVLADPYGVELEAGHLRLAIGDRGLEVQYYDLRLPVSPASLDGADPREVATRVDADALHELLERQHYRLAHWRTGRDELDYRRFFDIDSLAALRIEDPVVFEAVHRLPLAWVAAGVVDGLRIDHVDGLRDPLAYLRRVRAAAPHGWLVVEKILAADEELREEWPVDGTTGYEALAAIGGLFVDPEAVDAFTDLHAAFTGSNGTFAEVARAGKELALQDVLAADLERLVEVGATALDEDRTLRDATRRQLRSALSALIVELPVYRTYVDARGPGPEDVSLLTAAADRAIHELHEHDRWVLEGLVRVLLAEVRTPAETDLVLRLQQITGPVTAKGVEDTALYRYHRLVSLCEVGAHPAGFGMHPEEFHAFAARLADRWPANLVTTSTHDTKRSEDVRARVSLLTEIPQIWRANVFRWREMNLTKWPGEPDHALEYLLYQTLFGAHPLSVDRAVTFVHKAAREAKVHTSWRDPEESYESDLTAFVEAVLGDTAFLADLDHLCASTAVAARLASLAQVLVKLTMPGVPDLYQGAEGWHLRLVDPDNRAPVDADHLRSLAAAAESGQLPEVADDDDGATKWTLTRGLLRLRREHPDAFGPTGRYELLRLVGDAAAGAITFVRGERVAVVARTRLVEAAASGWGSTAVALPPGRWRPALGPGEEVTGWADLAALDGVGFGTVLVRAR